MNKKNNGATVRGMGLAGLTLLWALITQCLTWAGIISFPWIAIWLPFLISLGIWLIIFIIALIVYLLAAL